MNVEPRANILANSVHSKHDAADFLAAILPELATIARNSGIEELGVQIDQSAALALKIASRHVSRKSND